MSVSVRIPTILRSYTEDSSQVTAEGATLAEVLDSLESTYPGLKARVVDEDGKLRRFVNIYVDDEDIRFTGALGTPVSESSTVVILPAVAVAILTLNDRA